MASSDSEAESYEVEKILDSRKRGRSTEYLVKWKNFDDSENSWEPEKNLKHSKELLDAYKKLMPATPVKSGKTPKKATASVSRTREVSKSADGSVTTTTVTKSRAEMSSPESSPVLRRRTMESTRIVTQTSGAKSVVGRKSSWTLPKFKVPSCAVCSSFSMADLPIAVLLVCIGVVFATFIFPSK